MTDRTALPDTFRGQPRVENRHWVSPFNVLPAMTAGFTFPEPLGLIDSTVRKVTTPPMSARR